MRVTLLEALRFSDGSDELLLQQYHIDTMAPADWAAINATGKARVLMPPKGTAITVSDLCALARRHLPVVVANATLVGSGELVDILYQVNALPSGGFAVELSNPFGVDKIPCSPQRLDPHGAVRVVLELQRDTGTVVEWISGLTLVGSAGLRAGSAMAVVVAPGNASFVEFEPAATV